MCYHSSYPFPYLKCVVILCLWKPIQWNNSKSEVETREQSETWRLGWSEGAIKVIDKAQKTEEDVISCLQRRSEIQGVAGRINRCGSRRFSVGHVPIIWLLQFGSLSAGFDCYDAFNIRETNNKLEIIICAWWYKKGDLTGAGGRMW